MVSFSPTVFVAWMLACMIVGVGATLVIVIPMTRSMRETNTQYRQQLAEFGHMWVSLYEFQGDQVERHRRMAADMEQRFWMAVQAANGDGKGAKGLKAVTEKMLGSPSTSSDRPRRRGALTGPEEVRIARQSRMEAAGRTLMSAGSTDGQSTQTT